MACVNVGFSIFLFNEEGKVLLGLRSSDPEKGELEGGNWCLPGGKLDEGELVIDGIVREVKEETGLVLNRERVILISVVEHVVKKHYLSFVFLYEEPVKEKPQVLEPDEMLEWRWFDMESLPNNLYLPTKDALEVFQQYRSQKDLYTLQKFTRSEAYIPNQHSLFC